MKIKLILSVISIFFLLFSQSYGVNFDNQPVKPKIDNPKPIKIKRFKTREVRIKKFVEKNIINRFKIFRGNVKIMYVCADKNGFTISGKLVSPENRPMSLVGKFCEALENSKKFGVIIPSFIKKDNVEEQNKVRFSLMIKGNDNKIKNSEIK